MAVRGDPSGRGRVVALSRDPVLMADLRAALPTGLELIETASGFEAAAELLAGGATALVVDLRALGPAHQRLLQLARQQGLEMLGVGGLRGGMTLEDLSQLRLVAIADLPGALAGLTARAEATVQAAIVESPAAVVPPAPVPDPAAAPAATSRPAKAPRKRQRKRPIAVPKRPAKAAHSSAPEGQSEPAPALPADAGVEHALSGATAEPLEADEQAAAAQASPQGPEAAYADSHGTPLASSPRELLSEEELAALLEGEP